MLRLDPPVPLARLRAVRHNLLDRAEHVVVVVAVDSEARALVDMFNKNFAKFEVHVDADVIAAAPALRQAAE